jgi:hypothetical protein
MIICITVLSSQGTRWLSVRIHLTGRWKASAINGEPVGILIVGENPVVARTPEGNSVMSRKEAAEVLYSV